jgi:hypothetical protein
VLEQRARHVSNSPGHNICRISSKVQPEELNLNFTLYLQQIRSAPDFKQIVAIYLTLHELG